MIVDLWLDLHLGLGLGLGLALHLVLIELVAFEATTQFSDAFAASPRLTPCYAPADLPEASASEMIVDLCLGLHLRLGSGVETVFDLDFLHSWRCFESNASHELSAASPLLCHSTFSRVPSILSDS